MWPLSTKKIWPHHGNLKNHQVMDWIFLCRILWRSRLQAWSTSKKYNYLRCWPTDWSGWQHFRIADDPAGAHEPEWPSRMKTEDFRTLTSLIYAHVNPYRIFDLDMETRLPIEEVAWKLAVMAATRSLPLIDALSTEPSPVKKREKKLAVRQWLMRRYAKKNPLPLRESLIKNTIYTLCWFYLYSDTANFFAPHS